MDNQENNNPMMPKKKPSIFSILLMILMFAVITFGITYCATNGFDRTAYIKREDFVTLMLDKSGNGIKSAQVTEKEQTIVVITGDYRSHDNSYKGRYSVTITRDEYLLGAPGGYKYWVYKVEGGKEIKTPSDVNCEKSFYTLISEKASAEFGQTDGFVWYPDGDPYVTNWWSEWGPTIIMMIGGGILVIFLFTRLAGSISGSNKQALDFNKSRARRENNSKVRFSDVAGADEEKLEMKELVDYLKTPSKFSKFGAKLPKGVLLVGPPGCGKTLLAKAVAGEAGVPFYSISGSDFVEMFVGVGAGRVRDMFKVAKQNAPCLVFIDEIDAVGRQRGAGLGGGNDEREQTLNQLLVEMDGFSDNSGIIVIAATNRDDVLDPALLRAGRFDRKITVSLPDRKGREEIFKVHSRNKKLAENVNFENLSKRTVGFSGADIENIMNEAAILAVRKNETEITIADIDEAIDRRIAGPAKSSRSLSEHERKIVAYHEAGHAIIGLKYPHSDKVQKITIIPRGNTGGHVRMTPEEDRFLLTKKELEARIVGYLGGRSSEEIFFDDVSSGAQNDIEVATQIARVMVCELGMSSLGPVQYERDTGSVFLGRDYTNTQKNFSAETATKIDTEIHSIIDEAHAAAIKLIKKYKKEVILIANALIEREQITAEEIDFLLANGTLNLNKEETSKKTSEAKLEVKEDVKVAPEVIKETEDSKKEDK